MIVDDPAYQDPARDFVDDQVAAGGIMFANDLDTAHAGDFEARFFIPGQKSIAARVPVPADPAIQFLKFVLYDPMGMEYSVTWRAFTTDSNAPIDINHPTLPGSVPVEQVTGGDVPYIIVGIPVEGTNIAQYNLVGRYRADAIIGVEETAPADSGNFEIRQADMAGM